jgi:hypothetical protein
MLAVVFGFFLLQIVINLVRDRGIDFSTYVMSARALLEGRMPYDTGSGFRYIYPVFFSFIFIPLALIPYPAAVLMWYAAGLAALFYSVLTLLQTAREEIGIRDSGMAYFLLSSLALVFLPFLQHNFINGESNAFILLFCALFFKYYSKGRMIPACFFLALGISIKLVPLILVAYLLFRRRFGYILLTLGLTAAMFMLPGVMIGRRVFEYYAYYWQNFIMTEASVSSIYHGNEMYFTTSKLIAWITGPAGIGNTAATLAGLAVNGLFLAAIEAAAALRKKPLSRDAWVFAAYMIVMLMTMPKSQYHHLIYMTIAASMLLVKVFYDRSWFNAWGIGGIVTFTALFYAGKFIRHGPYFYLYLFMLLAGVFAALLRPRRAGKP